MKAPDIVTANSLIQLVEPMIERDAALGVTWLSGEPGRDTLRRMGVADRHNQPTSLEKERERVEGFRTNQDQLNWMIQYGDRIVGSIWVDLIQKEALPAPAIHIMIGDPTMRRKGIGTVAMTSVIEYLCAENNTKIFSRHLSTNEGAAMLLQNQGFVDSGDPYTDHDGLCWQNMSRIPA
jgi:RimJ/RimL family protein N-acetyltransferase